MKNRYIRKINTVKGLIPRGHQGVVNRILIDKSTLNAHYFELVHGTLATGGGSDYHSHDGESAFYILKGTVLATVGGKRFRAESGTAIFTPAKTKHKLKALTPAEILVIYAPQRSS